MKILSVEDFAEINMILTVLCALGVAFLVIVLCAGIKSILASGFEISDIPPLIIGMLLVGLLTYGGYCFHTEGVGAEYQATITDFNEVYDNGYEIIGREGEIYTLVKTKK